eukprot:8919414-Pyramimonas_sp.AAC.2
MLEDGWFVFVPIFFSVAGGRCGRCSHVAGGVDVFHLRRRFFVFGRRREECRGRTYRGADVRTAPSGAASYTRLLLRLQDPLERKWRTLCESKVDAFLHSSLNKRAHALAQQSQEPSIATYRKHRE